MMYKAVLNIPLETPLYDVHRDVMKLFSEKRPRILWRREGDDVTVISKARPVTVDAIEENPSFEVEKKYHFKIRVNPTVKRNGKRFLAPSIYAWLDRKGERHGFAVERITRLRDEGCFIAKNGTRLPSFDIAGVLTVMDKTKFHQTLTVGIGSQKAWGFGMLLII